MNSVQFDPPAQGVNGQRGQDIVEYSLLAGFIAVAAGAVCLAFREHQHHLEQDARWFAETTYRTEPTFLHRAEVHS